MNVPLWVWAATIAAIVVVIVADLLIIDRGESHEFSTREAAVWSTVFVALAVVFGLGVWVASGGRYAGEFFAGYLTEKSLSVDNLFVFLVIITRFAVPKVAQHKVLMIGVVLALILRGIFIAAGAAAIDRFTWVFIIFGVFLLWTGYGLTKGHHAEDVKEHAVLRWSRRVLPATQEYEGAHFTVRRDGRRLITPLFIVMIALGSTDVLFALDSIPAIFGLTTEPYLVFTANAFALLGLVQLYFLLGGLVERLVYLGYGLAFILAFIGVKLILHALHEYSVDWAPDVPIWLSLTVIVAALAVTTVASLVNLRRSADSADSSDSAAR